MMISAEKLSIIFTNFIIISLVLIFIALLTDFLIDDYLKLRNKSWPNTIYIIITGLLGGLIGSIIIELVDLKMLTTEEKNYEKIKSFFAK